MDLKRLKVGTKVKAIIDNPPYYSKGGIGTLINGTGFHGPEGVLDRDGDAWVTFRSDSVYPRVCVGVDKIKVLKY